MYPFRKVSLISPMASTLATPKTDPDIPRLLADGWRIFREWEVTAPGTSHTIWETPL